MTSCYVSPVSQRFDSVVEYKRLVLLYSGVYRDLGSVEHIRLLLLYAQAELLSSCLLLSYSLSPPTKLTRSSELKR